MINLIRDRMRLCMNFYLVSGLPKKLWKLKESITKTRCIAIIGSFDIMTDTIHRAFSEARPR